MRRAACVDELLTDDDMASCLFSHLAILAQVAREMIDAGEYEDVAIKLADETERRWRKSKFVRVWKEEKRAGRDPRVAFKERGWKP